MSGMREGTRSGWRGGLLTPESLAAMTRFRPTPQLGLSEPSGDDADEENGYGLGLITMKRVGLTLIGHGGLFTGHTAGLWYVPECELTIALYFNRGFVGQRLALDRILRVLTGEGGSAGSSLPSGC